MHPKSARLALAGCLALWLAMGALWLANPPEKKIADLKFSNALFEADQKFEEHPGQINLTGRAGRGIAGLSAVA